MAAEEKQKEEPQETRDNNNDKNKDDDGEDVRKAAPPQTGAYKREPEKVLFEWKAPARPFKPKSKQFWSTSIAVAVIFGSILYIIEGPMPVFVIIAFMFLYYVLTTVKPEEVEYKITNYGIKFADKLTEWPLLIRFWFTQRSGTHLLILDTAKLPGRIEMVINPKDKQKISDVMDEYLPEEEASPSGMERAADWFSKKMPDK